MSVPPPFQAPLRVIAELSDEAAAQLVTGLNEAPPFQQASGLTRIVASALPGADVDSASRLVQTLISLTTQLREAPRERVVGAISASLDFDLTPEQREQFRTRLQALLSSPAVVTTANALDLLTQHPRNYQTARVFSDIRPVFGSEVTSPPIGVVINETLQLHTWTPDGDTEIIHVALDEADLEELRTVIERALQKTSTLKKMLSDANTPYFELDKRDE